MVNGHVVNNPDLPFDWPMPMGDGINPPTDIEMIEAQIVSLQAMIDTLENMDGPGSGCPGESTMWPTTQMGMNMTLEMMKNPDAGGPGGPPPGGSGGAPPPGNGTVLLAWS